MCRYPLRAARRGWNSGHQAPVFCLFSGPPWGNCRPMQWLEETVHALVVMHDWKQQKELEDTIRDLVRLAAARTPMGLLACLT